MTEISQTIYKSDDGKEFQDKDQCSKHEAKFNNPLVHLTAALTRTYGYAIDERTSYGNETARRLEAIKGLKETCESFIKDFEHIPRRSRYDQTY